MIILLHPVCTLWQLAIIFIFRPSSNHNIPSHSYIIWGGHIFPPRQETCYCLFFHTSLSCINLPPFLLYSYSIKLHGNLTGPGAMQKKKKRNPTPSKVVGFRKGYPFIKTLLNCVPEQSTVLRLARPFQTIQPMSVGKTNVWWLLWLYLAILKTKTESFHKLVKLNLRTALK